MNDAWPAQRYIGWAAATLLAVALCGPGTVRAFTAAQDKLVDFHQEWTSGRFFLDGTPVYTRLEVGMERFQKIRRPPGRVPFLEYNAHPPTSVLVSIPFAHLDYPTAFLLWNVLSTALLVPVIATMYVQLGIRFHPRHLLVLVPALLVCEPLYQQILYGQWNLVLLALVVWGWAAERSGRPVLAGILIGTAAALKFLPGLLFLYFMFTGRWRVVAAGAAAVLAWTAATVAVLGVGAYHDYVTVVIPYLDGYRPWWFNFSIAGFWGRLFDGNTEFGRSFPVVYAPGAGIALTAVCDLLVVAVLAVVARRSATRGQRDLAFGLCLFAALLISPLTWSHYVVLLFLPLVTLWRHLRSEPPAFRWAFAACVAGLWVNPMFVWWVVIPELRTPPWWRATAQAWQVLAGISVPFYALTGLFAITAVTVMRGVRRANAPVEP